MPRTLSVLLCVVLFVWASSPLQAQAPKVGDWYEDASDLGFKLRMPKNWSFIPPSPDEPNLIGKYDPETNKTIIIPPSRPLWLHAWIVKFDRRAKSNPKAVLNKDGEVELDLKAARREMRRDKDLPEWLSNNFRGSRSEALKKDRTIDGTPATEYHYEFEENGSKFKVFCTLYSIDPEVDVAVIFNGPAGSKKWRKYSTVFSKMAKSFKRMNVEKVDISSASAETSTLRARKKALLLEEVTRTPGWELYETPNYFVITNNEDRQFVGELKERLEAIRGVYAEHYDPGKAREIRDKAEKARKEREAKEATGDELQAPPRTSTAEVDSMEQSRTSVVRVCATKAEYHSYGGPGGSAGYWNWVDEELVLYDDKQGGGRAKTWAVLNHEAFHQYIFYFYGNISPHSWYNEGTGDFYSGYEYKHKRFKLTKFGWRVGAIKEAIRTDKYVPLKNIVRFSQGEYYGRNKYGADGGQNYAQGWSLIYFLRTGKKKSRLWNDDWDTILNTYLETLAFTEDLDRAVEAAFAGVDWDELEHAWLKYTEK